MPAFAAWIGSRKSTGQGSQHCVSNPETVNGRAERMERRLELPLIVCALLTIPALIVGETVRGDPWDLIASALNWAIWAVFVTEVILMVWASEQPVKWLRDHPLELAIVVLSPPFLPAGLQAARVFRLLRVLRLVKGAMLARRLLSTEGIRDAAVFTLLTVLGGGLAYTAVEKGQHLSAWDGIWWAISTITTVGYGDAYPRTNGGRAIAVIVMFVGIGFVAVLTAATADRFMHARNREAGELQQVLARLDAMAAELETARRRD